MSETLEYEPPRPQPTVNVVGVQLGSTGRVHDYDAGHVPLRLGDRVVVQVARGNSLGVVAVPPYAVDARIVGGLPRVVKRADSRERARDEANRRRAVEAERICLHRIHLTTQNPPTIKHPRAALPLPAL